MLLRSVWAAFLLLLWQALLSAQNPGLMTDDSGEIVAAAHSLGIGHSPGFPLHMLLSRLFLLLPLGTPAFRLNLMAASFTLLSVLVVTMTARAFREATVPGMSRREAVVREIILVVTALSLLSCESVFAKSLTAKGGINTLVLFLLSLLLWAAGEGRGRRATLALFLFAAGLTNHWPLLLPWAPFLAVRYGPGWRALTARGALVAASLAIAGLSVFLYLPLRAALSPALNWEDPRALGPFLSVLSRMSSPEAEFATKSWAQYAANIRTVLGVMGGHWWPGFLLFAVAGIGRLLRERRRMAWGLLAGYALFMAAIVRAAHFDPLSDYLVADYLSTTQVVPAFLAAVGAMALFRARIGRRPRAVLAALAALLCASLIWGVRVGVRQEKSRYTLAGDLGDNLLMELPRGAVVLMDSDVTAMPVLHARLVEGKRPDVAALPLGLLRSRWGFAQIVRENRERVAGPFSVKGFGEAVRFVADPGRFAGGGFFYAYDPSNLTGAGLGDLVARLSPWGVAYRLGAGVPEASQASRDVLRNAVSRRLRGLEAARDLPGTEFTARVYRANYARPHFQAGNRLLETGDLYGALAHYRHVLSLAPGLGGVYLNLASYYIAKGYPEMAESFLQSERAVMPGSAAAERLRQEAGRLPRRSAAEYRALADRYARDGQEDLAEAARQAAEAAR
jgi:hypothetical protein